MEETCPPTRWLLRLLCVVCGTWYIMLRCPIWKFKTWFPKSMKQALMNDWCVAWCAYELHTRKMLNSRLWNSMWEMSWCVCSICFFLPSSEKRCPSGHGETWTVVVLTQYSWSCFLSKLIIQCLLPWIWPFRLCTLRKTWISVCDYSMDWGLGWWFFFFSLGWCEYHLCYGKNLAGSAPWSAEGFGEWLRSIKGFWGSLRADFLLAHP